LDQPSKGALNDPAFWQNFEALDVVRAFYDFELYPIVGGDLKV
jgi:hypothetical protein